MLRLVIMLLNFGLHFFKYFFFLYLEYLKCAHLVSFLFFLVYFGVLVTIFGCASLF